VATASADGTTEIWQLNRTERSPDELERLAQLLSGNRIGDDGATVVPLDAATLQHLWNELPGRLTALVGPKG
jgi:hypothetical protein